jgi:2-polyprenyl-3-methyl-5-hydroxy-6-metoxy-1,4-benzoquinol methylase
MPAQFFAEAYRGRPPWDIGRAQPAVERLAQAGEIVGPVLDVGCGTGENALYLAARGYEVVGIDAVEPAVHAARRKAARRRVVARFAVHDALDLAGLGCRFATVIDSGLFHSLSLDERPRFLSSLAAALRPGGRYFMLAFSELETRDGGPRRVTRQEIHAVFDVAPFHVVSIEPAEMATNLPGGGRRCWLARIERISNQPAEPAGA